MAESSNTNVICVDEKDLISELPRNLQETILNCMPVLDAVRTSMLSKQWRHCWTKIPDLIFGDEFPIYMDEKLSVYNDNPHLKGEEFVKVIHKVLQLHNGPILHFDLGFPQGLSAQTISDYINFQLIPLLSEKGVKQLVLEDIGLGLPEYYLKIDKLSSLNLTHLMLRVLKLQPAPVFGEFSFLTHLVLAQVGEDFDKQCIFHCPVLEYLTLEDCWGIFHTNFNAPNLKWLYERNVVIPLFELENITRFFFVLSVPNMEIKCNVSEFIDSLPNIEELCMRQYSIQYLAAGSSPNKATKPLQFLKTLIISDTNLADVSVLSCVLCLIQSVSNLRKLLISASTPNDSDEVTEDNFPLKDWKYCTIGLKTVEFKNLKGFRAELQVLEFLLAHCPLLESMMINWSGDVDKDAALTMKEAISEFPTLSPWAQIKYFENPNATVYSEW